MGQAYDIIKAWEDGNIEKQLQKLKFLAYTCESGVLGEDGLLHQNEYLDASWGLGAILNEIMGALYDFSEKMYAIDKGPKPDKKGQDKDNAPETESMQEDGQGHEIGT